VVDDLKGTIVVQLCWGQGGDAQYRGAMQRLQFVKGAWTVYGRHVPYLGEGAGGSANVAVLEEGASMSDVGRG
jgi:hypothetical protein